MPPSGFLQFAAQKYLSLETFRKNGQGVRTPLWFVSPTGPDHPNALLYVYTMRDSGKVKRIRNNPRVRIAPSDMRGNVNGEWVDAEARFVAEPREAQLADRLLDAKYRPWRQILNFFSWLRGKPRVVIALRVI